MDNKSKAPTRRVVNTDDSDVWGRIEREAQDENYGADSLDILSQKPRKRKKKKKKRIRHTAIRRGKSDIDVRIRHQRSQKEQRVFMARVRAAAAFIAALILIAAVLFLTPLFDIKSISISGNTIVSADQASALIGGAKGTNLFLASKSGMENKLKTLKYIKDVSIKKSLFPPSVDITVSEYAPAGYVQAGSQFLILDKDLYIIDEAGDFDLNTLPCVTGMQIKKGETGSTLIPESEETGKAVRTFLNVMAQNNETANTVSADFGNMNNITVNYENRITVYCGTQIDLERKLQLLCAAVENENIGPEARGTIEFNDKGEAIYTP